MAVRWVWMGTLLLNQAASFVGVGTGRHGPPAGSSLLWPKSSNPGSTVLFFTSPKGHSGDGGKDTAFLTYLLRPDE